MRLGNHFLRIWLSINYRWLIFSYEQLTGVTSKNETGADKMLFNNRAWRTLAAQMPPYANRKARNRVKIYEKKENIFEAEARKLQQSDVVYNVSWMNKWKGRDLLPRYMENFQESTRLFNFYFDPSGSIAKSSVKNFTTRKLMEDFKAALWCFSPTCT